jgi:hypothetical protein
VYWYTLNKICTEEYTIMQLHMQRHHFLGKQYNYLRVVLGMKIKFVHVGIHPNLFQYDKENLN